MKELVKILKIAKFEFLEKIRTKTFLVFMFLFPVIVLAISIVPSLLIKDNMNAPRIIGIIDNTENYFLKLIQKVNKFENETERFVLVNLQNPNLSESSEKVILKKADNDVLNGRLEGYFIINEENNLTEITYRSSNLDNRKNILIIQNAINEIQLENNLLKLGVAEDKIIMAEPSLTINSVKIQNNIDENVWNVSMIYISTTVMIMLLFTLTLFSGGMLVRSLIEEKSNRIMEILLSSCTVNELLTGKVIGLGLLGIFQISVWGFIGLFLFGNNFIPHEVFYNFGLAVLYFILGYLFFTSIFVGLGAVVNTEQEAQQFSSYLSVVMLVPLILSIKLLQLPNSNLAKALSYFPLTSSPVMLIRSRTQTLPYWEILLTVGILLFSIYITIKISSKLFRIGVLSYGKTPNIKEIFQWIKEK